MGHHPFLFFFSHFNSSSIMWLLHTIAASTIILSCSILIGHVFYIPFIISETELAHSLALQRVDIFRSLENEISMTLASIDFLRRHNNDVVRRSATSSLHVTCEPGYPGVPGPNGRDGSPGRDGPNGIRGLDARDIMEEIQEKQECIVCPQGEIGPIGAPGERGEPGDKGEKGAPGIPAQDGLDGEQGEEGPVGPPGPPGHRGRKGPDGKSAQGGVGEPGPKGAPGARGGPGPQGPRGKRNYIYGPPGPMGQPGPSGLDGIPGSPGTRGPKGEPGEKGADIKFCACPLELELLRRGKSSKKESKKLAEVQTSSISTEMPQPPSTSPTTTATTTDPLSTSVNPTSKLSIEPITINSLDDEPEDITIHRPNSFGGQPPGSTWQPTQPPQMIDFPTEFGAIADSNQFPLEMLKAQEGEEENDDDYEEITTTRRFRYVTKRPIRYP